MIPNQCIEVQTSPVARFSVPSWFAEVVILTQHLHCLSRNLTVRSSRNTLSGIIVAFSTIPPLHQFPFAEKTGSLYNVLKGSDLS
jgi:hypothetical protein